MHLPFPPVCCACLSSRRYSAIEESRAKVIVCTNYRVNPSQPSCGAMGGGESLLSRVSQAVEARGYPVEVEGFQCFGRCSEGPVVKLSPAGGFLCHVAPDRFEELMASIVEFVEADAASVE